MQNDKVTQPNDKSMNADKKTGLKDRVGDLIEKAGHKISEAGAPSLGQKVHDLGDSLEKKHDNPAHPHKV